MNGNKDKKSNSSQRTQIESKQCLMTGRSIQSVQANNFKTINISPWSGEDYYTKIRNQIQDQKQSKRSQTAKSMRPKFTSLKINPERHKVNTVQLQLMPISIQVLKDQLKNIHSKFSAQHHKEDQFTSSYIQKIKKHHCSTMIFKEVQPIHKKQSTTKMIRPRIERLHSEVIRDHNANSQNHNIGIGKTDKNCLLFFFQTKNSASVVNREKMIMKIRNIDKTKTLKVFKHKN